jgi:CubicO group peptidase (beta-lactamase class C family)
MILYERYARGSDAATRYISFSMGKSVVSTLVGMAVADGKIASLDDKVSKYLPDVAGGAYEVVSIRDVLEMSSGTSFDESQATATSDLARFIGVFARNQGGLYDFAKAFKPARPPGQKFNYASADTEVLGALVAKATGEPLATYLSRKVWQPMGAEADARWVLDAPGSAGHEVAAGGLSARLRDYGRFGLVFAQGGKLNGRQVVPADWVAEASRPNAPHLQVGNIGTNSPRGYGYQWWLAPGGEGVFMAIGIHGQYIFVDPKRDLVIVKTAAWPTPGGTTALVAETMAFHAGVAAALDRGEGR